MRTKPQPQLIIGGAIGLVLAGAIVGGIFQYFRTPPEPSAAQVEQVERELQDMIDKAMHEAFQPTPAE